MVLTSHSSLTESHEHQLGVFVEYSHAALNQPNYWERAQRFMQSFNHDKTIKADIYLVVPTISGWFIFNCMYQSIAAAYLDAGYGPPAPFPGGLLLEWGNVRGHNCVSFFTCPVDNKAVAA